jgi:hypothetical protein
MSFTERDGYIMARSWVTRINVVSCIQSGIDMLAKSLGLTMCEIHEDFKKQALEVFIYQRNNILPCGLHDLTTNN